MATRIEISTNKSGGTDIVTREATPEELKRLDSMMGAGEGNTSPVSSSSNSLSPAQRQLAKLRNNKPAAQRIEAVEVEGMPFYVLRLNIGELTRLGMYTPRDENGALNFADPDALTSLTAAMLFCCLVTGPEDTTPFFNSFGEALQDWALSVDDEVMSLVMQLFEQIKRVNPSILPDEEREKKVSRPKKLNAKKESESETPEKPNTSNETASMVPSNSTPADGLEETPSNAEHVILPTV